MNRFAGKKYQFFKAMTVVVIASFACWALAQQSDQSRANEKQIKRINTLEELGKHEEALFLADSLINDFKSRNLRPEWYDAVYKKTLMQNKPKERPEAIAQLQAIMHAETLNDSITAKIYGLLGYLYLCEDDYEMGARYYEKTLAGLLSNNCKSGLGTAYMNLGYALKSQGNYRVAIPYYLTSLPLLKKEGKYDNLSEALINLGDMSRFLNEFAKARQYYRQAFEVLPGSPGRLSSSLGWVKADEGMYEEALFYFREARRQGEYTAEEARIMGACEEKLGDTLKANLHYRDALQLAEDDQDSTIVLNYIGKALLKRKQPEAALRIFQQALYINYPKLRTDHPEDNPETFEHPDFWTVELLSGKARAFHYLYQTNRSPESLHFAYAAASGAARALDVFQGEMSDDSGRDAVDYAYNTYETGVRIGLDLQLADPEHAEVAGIYDLAERARSRILKTNMLEKDVRRSIDIPNDLEEAEQKALADQSRWEEKNKPDSLLAVNRRLDSIKSKIYEYAPVLKKARTQLTNTPVADIIHTLQKGELLLQYFWGDNNVVVFAVTRQGVRTHVIERSRGLTRMVDTLQSALQNRQMTPEAYAACALPVYRQLIAPVLEQTASVDRLFIVPDGPLWSIPFEALCGTPDGRFLVEDYQVSYHWSGAMWWQSRTEESRPTAAVSGYGGFAPRYGAAAGLALTMGRGFGDLPEARVAVRTAGEAWGGTVYTGSEVNQALFQREAGRFEILHLAMHGYIDSIYGTGLVFPASNDSVSILSAREISKMNLPARLAVLSACNTGSGAIFRGEGVMSLARAFALAGCPAITANLWEVPSEETNRITTRFLALLKKGDSKDGALRSAKLDFLKHAEPERRHPYFWAAQVLIGNEKPLHASRLGLWLGMLAGLLVVLAGVAYYRFKIRRAA